MTDPLAASRGTPSAYQAPSSNSLDPRTAKLKQAWTSFFYDSSSSSSSSLDALRSRAINGQIPDPATHSLRWIHWKRYLSEQLSSTPSSWTGVLNREREEYAQLRSRLLRAPDGNYPPEVGFDADETGAAASARPPVKSTHRFAAHQAESSVVHDLSVNNPLSLDESNPWKTYYASLEVRKIISQDVERTFPDLPLFRDVKVQRGLTNALFVWSLQKEDVGYRQGMHELLAVLWMVRSQDAVNLPKPAPTWNTKHTAPVDTDDEIFRNVLGQPWIEHDVYTLFCVLMKNAKSWFEWRDPPATTSPAASASLSPTPSSPTKTKLKSIMPIVAKCERIQSLLHYLDPALAQHLDSLGVEPQIFALRWIRLIFTREFALDDALVIWDGLFASDPSLDLIDFVCLAVLMRVRNQLLAADYSTALQTVLRYPSTTQLHPELFVKQAIMIKKDGAQPSTGVAIMMQNRDLLGIEARIEGVHQAPTSPASSANRGQTPMAYQPRAAKFATVGRAAPGAHQPSPWTRSNSRSGQLATSYDRLPSSQNTFSAQSSSSADPLGAMPSSISASTSRATGINPSAYLPEGISDFAKGLYERADLPQTLNAAITNVSKSVAAAAASVAASSGPGYSSSGRSGFPSGFDQSFTATNPAAARGSTSSIANVPATVGHAGSAPQRRARQPLPGSLERIVDEPASSPNIPTRTSSSVPELTAKLEGLTKTNKAIGSALAVCIQVLEDSWLAGQTTGSVRTSTADRNSELPESDVNTLMSFTALKHIRDVLDGTAKDFDPATLPQKIATRDPAPTAAANSGPSDSLQMPTSRNADNVKHAWSNGPIIPTAPSASKDIRADHPPGLPMSLPEYARYGRQMILPDFGLEAQLRLRNAKVLVVGAGGLGCPAVQYLAAAGVGHISILDHDVVEPSNLARQILHSDAKVGMQKAESAAEAARIINPYITVTPHCVALTSSNARQLIRGQDLVLDCTDNPLTRYLVSDASVLEGVQVVSGAAQGYDGQLVVLHKKLHPQFAPPSPSKSATTMTNTTPRADSKLEQLRGPCYRCLFPQAPKPEDITNCEDGGVLGGVTGLVGTMQALEAVKILAEIGEPTPPLLTLVAPLTGTPFRSVKLRARRIATCRSCGDPVQLKEAMITDLEKEDYVSFCGLNKPVASGNLQRTTVQDFLPPSSKKEEGDVLVVDVRPPIEYGIARLPNSLNLPLQKILKDPESSLRDIRQATQNQKEARDRKVLLVCKKGNDSQVALRTLLDQQQRERESKQLQTAAHDQTPAATQNATTHDPIEPEPPKLEFIDPLLATATTNASSTRTSQSKISSSPPPPNKKEEPKDNLNLSDLVGGLRLYAQKKDPSFPVY